MGRRTRARPRPTAVATSLLHRRTFPVATKYEDMTKADDDESHFVETLGHASCCLSVAKIVAPLRRPNVPLMCKSQSERHQADDLRRVERLHVRAWRALETAIIHGWLWRYSGGGSQRANSVWSLCGGRMHGYTRRSAATRRRGRCASQLEVWAGAQGVRTLALQAVAINTPAVMLYTQFGFGSGHQSILVA